MSIPIKVIVASAAVPILDYLFKLRMQVTHFVVKGLSSLVSNKA